MPLLETLSAIGGLASGAGALAGGLSSLFGSDDDDAREQQYQYSRQLQQDAQRWQSQENLNAFYRNRSLLHEQQGYNDIMFARQNQEYDRRLADERSYNSPAAQVARGLEIGVNPSASLGMGFANNETFAPPTAESSPSAPSAAPANGVSSPSVGLMNTKPSSVGAFAQAIKAVTSGLKDISERNRIEKLLTYEIKDAMLENQIKDITLFIGKATKDAKIKQEFQRLANMKVENLLNGQFYNESVQKELMYESERWLNSAKRNMTHEQYRQLLLYNDNFDRILDARIDAMRQESFKNFQEGQLFGSAKVLNDDQHILNLPDTEMAKRLFNDREQLALKYENIGRDLRNAGKLSDKEFELLCIELDNAKNINQFPWWLKSMKKLLEWFGERATQVPVSGVKMIK